MKTKLRITCFISLFSILITIQAQENRNRPYLNDATIENQLNYVIEESSRWEIYKMVPERWLNQLRTNTNDTLALKDRQFEQLKDSIHLQQATISSLESDLATTALQLTTIQKEKDSFAVLGMAIHKRFFLSVVIFLILGAFSLAGFIFFLFQKNLVIIRKTKEELAELKGNFEDYRQKNRRKQEDLAVKHHKEIQKLKGIS